MEDVRSGKANEFAVKSPDEIKFPRRLMEILHSGRFDNAIKWSEDGKSFVVLNRDEVSKKVHFEIEGIQVGFTDFSKRLDNYGFEKHPDRDEWRHPNFRRGIPCTFKSMGMEIGYAPCMHPPIPQNGYPPRILAEMEAFRRIDMLTGDLHTYEWTQDPNLKDTSGVPSVPLPFEYRPPNHRGVDWRLPFEYNHPNFSKDAQNAALMDMAQNIPKKEIEKEQARLQDVLDETRKLMELSDASKPGLRTKLESDKTFSQITDGIRTDLIPDVCTSFIDGILMMVEYGNGVMIKCLDDGRSFQVLKKGDLDIYFHHIAIIDGFAATNYDLFSTLLRHLGFESNGNTWKHNCLRIYQYPQLFSHCDIRTREKMTLAVLNAAGNSKKRRMHRPGAEWQKHVSMPRLPFDSHDVSHRPHDQRRPQSSLNQYGADSPNMGYGLSSTGQERVSISVSPPWYTAAMPREGVSRLPQQDQPTSLYEARTGINTGINYATDHAIGTHSSYPSAIGASDTMETHEPNHGFAMTYTGLRNYQHRQSHHRRPNFHNYDPHTTYYGYGENPHWGLSSESSKRSKVSSHKSHIGPIPSQTAGTEEKESDQKLNASLPSHSRIPRESTNLAYDAGEVDGEGSEPKKANRRSDCNTFAGPQTSNAASSEEKVRNQSKTMTHTNEEKPMEAIRNYWTEPSNGNGPKYGSHTLNCKLSNKKLLEFKRSLGSNFPLMLMWMLDCGYYRKHLKWSDDGLSFIVLSTDEFINDVLPAMRCDGSRQSDFFKMLTRWNFQNENGVWKNPSFRKGRHDLCKSMKSEVNEHTFAFPLRETHKAGPKSPKSPEDVSEGEWSLLRDSKDPTDSDEWEVLDDHDKNDDDNNDADNSAAATYRLVSLLQDLSMKEQQQDQPNVRVRTTGTDQSLAIASLAELLRATNISFTGENSNGSPSSCPSPLSSSTGTSSLPAEQLNQLAHILYPKSA